MLRGGLLQQSGTEGYTPTGTHCTNTRDQPCNYTSSITLNVPDVI